MRKIIFKLPIPLIFITLIYSFFGEDSLYNANKGVLLDGIDIVSILNNSPEKGKKEFQVEKDGLIYYFSSKENLQTFKANPDKFIPAFGGWCAYAMAESPQKVEINPKSYKVVNGKLLLFYNAWGINTLKKWNDWNDDAGKLKEAQVNWGTLKSK